MKVRASIKKQQPGDQIVRRKGRLYRINKLKPRRKARQGYRHEATASYLNDNLALGIPERESRKGYFEHTY